MENNEYDDGLVEQAKKYSTASKFALAILLFILPIIGFLLGVKYQQTITPEMKNEVTVSETTKQLTATDMVEQKLDYTESAKPEVQKKPHELWLITTSFDTVFLDNASTYRKPLNPELLTDREYFTPETFVSNTSYKDLEVLSIKMDKEYEIRDTKDIPGSNIMYTTASYNEAEYALEIDLNTKEATVLFSSSEYPDFINTSISSASTDNNALLFMMSSCTGCAPSLAGQAVYNLNTKNYLKIGKTSAFEWLDSTNFRYKPIPQGCDDYFTKPFGKERPNPVCEQKLVDTEWITNSV